MKKLRKICALMSVLFFTLMLMPKAAFAKEANYKLWTAKNNVEVNKQWTITFNSKVNPDTINNQNIKVIDEGNNSIDTSVTICDDGKKVKVDAPKDGYTQGKTYTLTVANISNDKNTKLLKPIKMPFTIKEETKEKPTELSKTIKDVTVKIKKIEQDTDSLKVYVSYINNSKDEILTGDSLAKIVHANRQYAYDNDFNFTRTYEKDIAAPDSIQPKGSADSVIFFKPIANVDKINVVLSSNFEEYRFDNVKVNDMAKGKIKPEQQKKDNVLKSLTQNNITININKVVQDNDSLKVYVTYINNDNKAVLTGDSLAKVIANGKEYEYDNDFNFSRYYDKNVPHAQDSIESTVHEKSVIYFTPVKDASSIDLVLNAGFEEYRFDNVKIEKNN